MGRTLESLKQGDGQRNGARDVGKENAEFKMQNAECKTQNAIPDSAICILHSALPTADEEYPFIEVGGPGKKLEASPTVLATPLPSRPALPDDSRSLPPATGLVPALTQPRPMTVAFESWPGLRQASQRVATEVIAYHQPDHPVSKQYGHLFGKLVEDLAQVKSPVLLFMGAAARTGTTTVLLNLAFSGCSQQRRIVLVEGNLRRPALANRLGLSTSPGLTEVLAGSVALEQALSQTLQPLLYALTASAGPTMVDLLSPDALRWALGRLRDRFDLVLVDGPDREAGSELTSWIAASDGLYLVLQQGAQETAGLNAMTQSIARMGGRLRGLIHTQFENL